MPGEGKNRTVDKLSQYIQEAEKSIRIVAGELDHKIYHQPRILNNLRDAVSLRNVDVQIMVGPIISVTENKSNGIIKLWREKLVRIYRRPARQNIVHFWVIDNERIYAEDPHPPLLPLKGRREMRTDYPEFWARKMGQDFDDRIKDGEAFLSEDLQADFLFLTPAQVEKLSATLQELHSDYDFRTKKELEDILASIGERSSSPVELN